MSRHTLGLLFMVGLLWPGCNNERRDSPEVVTFHRDVAPILFDRCVSCHHPDGAAPFSLLTYEEARDRAGQIAEVTASRYMPPWLPEVGHEELAGLRRLSATEIEKLASWSAAGAPQGTLADSRPAPKFRSAWQLGAPDLVLESPPFALSADGRNRFRNFVLRVPEGVRRWVRAVEIRPKLPQVTHHARLGIDTNNESVRRDSTDDEAGYEGMAWGRDPEGQLITWTPGMTADGGTAETAWELSADEALVLHAHLQPSGKPETVAFQVGFYFADAPPTLRPMMLRIGSRDIDIPPNQSRHAVADIYELPVDVDLHFVFPHAHSLCREILLVALLPGGAEKTLLSIKRFSENWHDTYRFARPVRLPRGTRLETTFTYDNSAANVRNPNNPPQRVVYGSNAEDEMADVYLQVTPRDPAQYAALAEHQAEAELKSKIAGYRKSLELHPDDPWNAELLASCHVNDSQPDEAIRLLETRPELLLQSAQANIVLGMAYLAQGDMAVAEKWLRQAIKLDDRSTSAWLGLGQVLAARSQHATAEEAYRRAVELSPQQLRARLDLADLLIQQNRLTEAESLCIEAIALASNDQRPHSKLAAILAQQQRYEESLRCFATARELAPFLYSPESSLAILCYQFGDEAKADELLKAALKQNADDPVPHCFLGQIARRNGELGEAREYLLRAAELPRPSCWPGSHTRQYLTLVYREQLALSEEMQDEELASRAASAWLRIEPDNASLRSLVQQLSEGVRTE